MTKVVSFFLVFMRKFPLIYLLNVPMQVGWIFIEQYFLLLILSAPNSLETTLFILDYVELLIFSFKGDFSPFEKLRMTIFSV